MQTHDNNYQSYLAQIDQDAHCDIPLYPVIAGLTCYHIRVYESCIGHEQADGFTWPYLAFQSPEDFAAIESEADDIAARLDHGDYQNDPEHDQLLQREDELYQIARQKNIDVRRQVWQLLDEFYRQHPLEYGYELIVTNFGYAYGAIHNSQQETFHQLPKNEQAQFIQRCQQEFIDFGEFLRHRLTNK